MYELGRVGYGSKGEQGGTRELILGPLRFPQDLGGPTSEMQEGRDACPRGPSSVCFDGLLGGVGSACAWSRQWGPKRGW
jgi:hypothetical protein